MLIIDLGNGSWLKNIMKMIHFMFFLQLFEPLSMVFIVKGNVLVAMEITCNYLFLEISCTLSYNLYVAKMSKVKGIVHRKILIHS